MKVGELAKRTGLTVRTLHHYDEIGLLTPSHRTAAGHRVYGATEIRRLQQIASLRQLGLALEDIRTCLDRPELSLERILELQIRRIEEEMDRAGRLKQVLEGLRSRLRSAEEVSVDELTRAIEVTMSYEKYYTPEQLQELAERRESIGEERIQEVQEEWRKLFAAFGKAMEDGIAPDSPEVKILARRSAALIREFTGGDPGIMASLSSMYRQEGGENVMERHDMPMRPGLWEYMGKARSALEAEKR
ncbi:MAG: MerR family transcriptional regulator [Longimicrobiales bacterium]|nr:MerR family transcriptional regulator [Longimicrobiales bacterium]